MTATRYALQPRVGDTLHLSDEESWPVTNVRRRGLTITVIDRIGRSWDLTRAERGCWLLDARTETP